MSSWMATGTRSLLHRHLNFKNVTAMLLATVMVLFLFQSCQEGEDELLEDYFLIYNGDGADADGAEAVGNTVADMGYDVKYISDLDELTDNLDGAVAFVIGGTEDDGTSDILESLYESEEDLKTFLQNGGHYLGICGGAYIASRGSNWSDGYEDGLSLVDIPSFAADSVFTGPQVISVTWLGQPHNIYYQYGPAFAASAVPAEATIIAYYDTERVASFLVDVGDGRVALCGPHPEADETWTEEYDGSMIRNYQNWQDTDEIFVDLLERLMAE